MVFATQDVSLGGSDANSTTLPLPPGTGDVIGGNLQALVSFGAQNLYIQGDQVNAFTMMLTPATGDASGGGLQALVAYGAQDVYIGQSPPSWWIESPTTVPEPNSLAMLGGGLVGLMPFVRRKRIRVPRATA